MNFKQLLKYALYAKTATETAAVFGQTAHNVYERYNERREFRFEVRPNSALFEAVTDWVSSKLDLDTLRDVQVSSLRKHDEHKVVYNVGKGIGHVMHDGHKVYISSIGEEKGRDGASIGPSITPGFVLAVRTPAARAAIELLLESLLQEKSKRGAGLFLPDSWGDWARSRDLPRRPLETVAYSDAQGAALLADVHKFLQEEDRYDEFGMPWHRGYLLHGAPGTGKTSTAMAIAYETGRDLFYLPLGDLNNDIKLIDMVSNVPAGGILLLEDVDVFGALIKRTEENNKISMAGILNVLDGAMTPHGLITIMTTNHYAKLDPAITRPGRVDFAVEFVSTQEQVQELYARFYGRPLSTPCTRLLTPAAAVQLFMGNDAQTAAQLLQERTGELV